MTPMTDGLLNSSVTGERLWTVTGLIVVTLLVEAVSRTR